MELQEILKMPDGFTPPDVTVKIEKVYERKSGDGENGPWSFQDVQVVGGKLKLKNVDEVTADRVGQTVTLRAFQSKQHGLTGLKVAHEEYKNQTYDKLVITPTCIWEWQNGNGHAPAKSNGAQSNGNKSDYKVQPDAPRNDFNIELHLSECARIANDIAGLLNIQDDAARQACFATVCIDAQRHNVILGDSKPSGASQAEPADGRKEALLKGVRSACKLLNDEGYEPPFSPKALDEFANERFQATKGVAGLSAEDTEDLLQVLSEKLDNFRLNKRIGEDLEDDSDTPF